MNARLSYLEGAVRGASPVRLVILLYGQAIEDLRRAVAAHVQGEIEERTRQINHAILVIGHLQATLDENRGGVVAANLQRFYNLVRAELIRAQCRQSASALEQQISHLMLLRDAWGDVERAADQTAAPAPAARPSNAGNDPALGKWKA
jgi:flagellar secretion chaperone FliS